jgi:hypothetical protein
MISNNGLKLRIDNNSFMMFCIVMSMVFGLVLYFSPFISDGLRVSCYFMSMIFGFTGIFIYCANQGLRINSGFRIWLILFLYMLVTGLVMSSLGHGTYNTSDLISQDLRHCMYALIGFIFADTRYFSKYTNIFAVIGKIGIIAGIIALGNYGFDINKVTSGARLGIWELPYYCWWILGATSLFLFANALFNNTHRKLGFTVQILYVALGVLFLKRAPIVETAIIYICYVFLARKRNRVLKTIITVAVLLIVFKLLLSEVPYFEALNTSLQNRFSQDYATSSRVSEVTVYLEQTPLFQKIFGYGLGNEFIYMGAHKNSIHIGFYDALYKGGLPFILYYVVLLFKTIKLLYYRFTGLINLTDEELCAISLTILGLVSLSFGMCFSYTMVILNFTPSFGIVLGCTKNDDYIETIGRST